MSLRHAFVPIYPTSDAKTATPPATTASDAEPRRWLDDDDASSFRAILLRSAASDAPPPRAAQRLKERLPTKDAPMTTSHLFNAILSKRHDRPGRFRSGAVFSVGCHVAVVALVALASTRTPAVLAPLEPNLTFFAAPHPAAAVRASPALAPQTAASPQSGAARAPIAKRLSAIETTREREVAADPTPTTGATSSVEAEAASGAGEASGEGPPGPSGGGAIDGFGDPATLAAASSSRDEVLAFGEGMTRPAFVSGPIPSYTREALEAKVAGTLLARCVIAVEGRLTSCRILKSLLFMDTAVLAALAEQRYSPATYQGHPQAIADVIPFTFKLP